MTEKFREYLLGHKCVVYTDNNPLSHLSSAKLGAMEQRWAAWCQLAAFDFEIRYHSGRLNKNADALSHERPPGARDMEAMLPGTSLPEPLQQALWFQKSKATPATVVALPHYVPSDPVIQEVLVFSSASGTAWWRGVEFCIGRSFALMVLRQNFSFCCLQP